MMGENRSVLTRPSPPPPLTLRYGDAPEQVADGWPGGGRAADRPLLLLIHGGFWRPEYDREHIRPMAAALRATGWTVASVEYRREPGRPHATVRDVRTALATVPAGLDRRGGPYNGSVMLAGHSAGGHLALWAAATASAPGLVGTLALAPVADLRLAHELDLDHHAVTAFLGGPPRHGYGLDPARLPTPSTPVVIVHGTHDARVPMALTESYAAAHPATRIVPVPGAGHYELIDPLSAAWPAVTGALSTLATGPVPGPEPH